MATEAELRAAIATADHVLAGSPPYPRELFPELGRREPSDRRGAASARATRPVVDARREGGVRHPRPVTPAAEAELAPEAVAAWSADLGFAAPAKQGRITRATD
jgi:hypothetical protein